MTFLKNLLATASATLLAIGLMAPVAHAQSFQFETDGSASGEFEANFTESVDFTASGGAEFNFGGGAGSDGKAVANGGDYAVTGGLFVQEAGGSGDAYSNTNGANYAQADFASASYAANGGIAYDERFGNQAAKTSFDGIVTAGGAGSVETGLTAGLGFEYNVSGAGSYEYDADNSASLN